MKKFTKKVVSLAAATVVTVTSVFTGDVVFVNAADDENVTIVTDAASGPAIDTTDDSNKPFVSQGPAEEVAADSTVAPLATLDADYQDDKIFVNQPDGQVFYEEDSDALIVKVYVGADVKNAYYTIDDGAKMTLSAGEDGRNYTIKVGEGKIANSKISLKIYQDGAEAPAEYTYHKLTKVEKDAENVVSANAAMVKMFSVVKAMDTSVEKTYGVCMHKRSSWSSDPKPVAHVLNSAGTETTINMEKMDDAGNWWYAAIPAYNPSYLYITASKGSEEGRYPDVGEKLDQTDFSKHAYIITGNVWIAGDKSSGGEGTHTVYTSKPSTDNAPAMPTAAPTVAPATDTPTPSATATVAPTAVPTATPTAVVATATPTAIPTATVEPTAAPELDAYFGSNLSAPQYTTAKQVLTAKAVNCTGTVKYTFSIDGEEVVKDSTRSEYIWNPSELEEGSHDIEVTVSDESGKTVTKKKTYTLVEEKPEVEPTATATVTPTVPASTPAVTATVKPSPVVTATVAAPTNTPVATTAAAVTATPSAVASTTGIISYSKKNKTVGEAIKVKFALTGVADSKGYKYTYTVTKGSKTKTLAKKTTKKSVNWTLTTKGANKVQVNIYDATGKLVGVATSTYNVKARVITIKSIKAKTVVKGKKKQLNVTTKATTKKGKVSYKIVLKKANGKAVASKAYSKKNQLVWKKAKKGKYTVYVTVKNGKGVVVTKTKSVKVK